MEYASREILLKNGKTCLIRHGTEQDAELLVEYLKATAGETRYLSRDPEEKAVTLEEERAFIREANSVDRALNLLAFADGQFAGHCGIHPVADKGRTRHRCSVGIALYRKFCGMGIGTALMDELLTAARSAGYEQAELEVVSSNAPAIGLYKKFGFQVTGTLPRAFKYRDGSYADFLFMVKDLT